MIQRKNPGNTKKVIWRMTDAAPLGEFVDPNVVASPPPKARPEGAPGGWVVSSFELLQGTEISEGPDTVPDDLFDELFPPSQDTPAGTERK
jgi:hypothetical protein